MSLQPKLRRAGGQLFLFIALSSFSFTLQVACLLLQLRPGLWHIYLVGQTVAVGHQVSALARYLATISG